MEYKTADVIDRHGIRGTVDVHALSGEGTTTVPVTLETGDEVLVARSRLARRKVGGYRYDGTFSDGTASDSTRRSAETVEEYRMPLAREELHVRRQTRETGRVRISKKVHAHTEEVDEPVLQESVEVQRVPIDRIVDEPVSIRHEGDVTIIPVMEERLVVRKELVLKEELHVRKHRSETREVGEVTLRSEEAVVEREHANETPREASGPTEAPRG